MRRAGKAARTGQTAALTVSAALLGSVLAAPALAAAPAPAPAAKRTATCAEMNTQLWSFKAEQVVAECHAKRAARAAERAKLVVGKAPGKEAKSYSRTAPKRAQGFADQAMAAKNPSRAANRAFRTSQEAAALSGAIAPAKNRPQGAVLFATTEDRGFSGNGLEARQAARNAWKAARQASKAHGKDRRLNIAADRAELQAWKTARTAGWIK
ncbi:hypothetical protein ACWGJ2_09470 [Streptomyces sp. NPDC054796]